jgi:hypothetical protein
MENHVISANTNQPPIEDVLDDIETGDINVVNNTLHPRLLAFTWEQKEFLILSHEADPRGKTDKERSTLIIVAKSIEIMDNDGTIIFSQELDKLSSPNLRIIAKNFGCRNVGSMAKFQVRLQMALKKTMMTNYSINEATSTLNAITNTKNYIRVINACFHPDNFESFLKINDRKDRKDFEVGNGAKNDNFWSIISDFQNDLDNKSINNFLPIEEPLNNQPYSVYVNEAIHDGHSPSKCVQQTGQSC